MKLELFAISMTLLISDIVLCKDVLDVEVDGSMDNPWRTWQYRDTDTDHDITRRSVRVKPPRAELTDVATMEDELYTGQATSSGNQRRHQHITTRRQRQPERQAADDDTYDEYSDGKGVPSSMLSDESQWPENCTYCAMRQASREYRLEQIRREILAKLRLESPPNITDKRLPQYPEISEWLSKFPETPTGEDSMEPMVKIISMINIAHPPPPEKTLPDMRNVCFFEFQSDVEASDIVSAKMGIFIRRVAISTNTITMFLIYKVKPRRRGNILIKRKRITLNTSDTNKWYRFDVDAVVKSWVRNPHSNYGLQIMIFDDYGHSLAIVNPENKEEELYKPYIEVEIREQSNSRERRMTGLDCHEEGSETRCCRYPLLVDFESYGWDWIIQPKRYRAYYCSGECNFAFLMSSAYGHLLQQTSKGNGPCCTPRKMSQISMLYFDQDYNIVYGTLPSMVVDRCGCS